MSSIVTTDQSRAMGQRVLQMFSDVLNSIATEIEDIPRPIVRAFSVTGSTITATCDTITLTAVEEGGGIWEFKLPKYGTWIITATTPTGETYTKVVEVDDVKKYVVGLGIEIKRYGYRIRESEPDPYERVEYILDAVGMTPAHMDFENEVFDYGSWRDVWFVADNKPLMLKYDGTVDYYLDPNDYTLREDGEMASDVSNTAYEGNAMAQMPLCWIYRYEDDTYKYEIVSNVKYDEKYKAYAHVRADGSIAEYFYQSLFGASGNGSKLRSLSEQTTARGIVMSELVSGARSNGEKWYIGTWSQHEYIRTLIVLLGKTTNSQIQFGHGNNPENGSENSLLTTGTLKDKGQFFGYSTTDKQVKVLHIEGYWGDVKKATAGILLENRNMYVKMTPEGEGYQITSSTGYIRRGIYLGTGFVKKMDCTEKGMIPKPIEYDGSSTTYYCDYCGVSIYATRAGRYYYLDCGGSVAQAVGTCGAFGFLLNHPYDNKLYHRGCYLMCEQPKEAETTNE